MAKIIACSTTAHTLIPYVERLEWYDAPQILATIQAQLAQYDEWLRAHSEHEGSIDWFQRKVEQDHLVREVGQVNPPRQALRL